jgi:hypothetical protein
MNANMGLTFKVTGRLPATDSSGLNHNPNRNLNLSGSADHASPGASQGGFASAAKPGVVRMAGRVARAFAKWMAAGMPTRSDAEVARVGAICRGCEFWNANGLSGIGQCSRCGCGPLKWEWATEECVLPGAGKRWEADWPRKNAENTKREAG